MIHKQSGGSMEAIMRMIADNFQVKMYETKTDTYRVQVESIEKYREVITYFSTYSLMSYKYFNYMKVLEVHNMLNKEHLSDIGRSKILAIKEKIHNYSEWTHLNKFPLLKGYYQQAMASETVRLHTIE